MTFSALLALGWLGLAPAPATLVPPTAAAVPVPAAASAPSLANAAADGDADAPAAATTQIAPDAKAPTYLFTLGEKRESVTPCTHGDAKGDGKIEIEAGENQLKTVLGADAGANVFLGAVSTATASVQLVQEFEITCSDPSIQQVYLTLESNLLGFLRSKHKASAGLKLASATIAPIGWTGPPLAVSYPTGCIGGPTGCNGPRGYKYETPLDPVKSPAMPLGRYVLQANFVATASASGLLDAHSTAIFMTESEDLDAWEREHDPYKGDSHDDFGLTIVLKADAPPGYPAVSHRKPAKRVGSRSKTRRVH